MNCWPGPKTLLNMGIEAHEWLQTAIGWTVEQAGYFSSFNIAPSDSGKVGGDAPDPDVSARLSVGNDHLGVAQGDGRRRRGNV